MSGKITIIFESIQELANFNFAFVLPKMIFDSLFSYSWLLVLFSAGCFYFPYFVYENLEGGQTSRLIQALQRDEGQKR